jgi:hypothetical protein
MRRLGRVGRIEFQRLKSPANIAPRLPHATFRDGSRNHASSGQRLPEHCLHRRQPTFLYEMPGAAFTTRAY